MHESIQELTEKIYQEGVEKAEIRAQEILDDAAAKARQIVDEAEVQATEIIKDAERKASQIHLKSEAELALSARNAIIALKQRIADMVVWQINHKLLHDVVSDIAFMQSLITKLIDAWSENFGQQQRLQLLLPENDYQEYRAFLEAKAGQVLSTGLQIEFSDSLRNGFQLNALDQGFKIHFSDHAFEEYFSAFARPRIYKLLFGKES